MSHEIGQALDGVHRFRHPERAAVHNSPGRLVRVDPVDFHKGVLEIVRAGADIEQARRPLKRVGCRVHIAVIGGGLDAQRGERAVLLSRQLGRDVVIPTKRIGAQIFRAVLNPFDW